MKQKAQIDRLGFAALAAVIIAWALGPLFVRFFSTLLDPWLQNALRYSSAALVLLPLLLRHYRRGTVSAADWRHAFLTACFLVAMQSCWTGAIYHINPGFASILGRLSLLWICLVSFILFPEERHLLKKNHLLDWCSPLFLRCCRSYRLWKKFCRYPALAWYSAGHGQQYLLGRLFCRGKIFFPQD